MIVQLVSAASFLVGLVFVSFSVTWMLCAAVHRVRKPSIYAHENDHEYSKRLRQFTWCGFCAVIGAVFFVLSVWAGR